MRKYTEEKLSGAMTAPCPVCHLKPARGVNFQGVDAGASDGAYTICFGCGLVQVIHDGMRCALTEAEAEFVFYQPEVITSVIAVARLRAINPMRVGEIVRKQKEHPARPCPDCGAEIPAGPQTKWPLCPCGYPHK